MVELGLGVPTWTCMAFLHTALGAPIASSMHLRRTLKSWNTIYTCDLIHRHLNMVMSDKNSEMWRVLVALSSSIGVHKTLLTGCITHVPLLVKRNEPDICFRIKYLTEQLFVQLVVHVLKFVTLNAVVCRFRFLYQTF